MLGIILKAVTLLPTAIRLVENVFGKGDGATKESTVLNLVLQEVEAEFQARGVTLTDPAAQAHLKMVVDGLVGLFNDFKVFQPN